MTRGQKHTKNSDYMLLARLRWRRLKIHKAACIDSVFQSLYVGRVFVFKAVGPAVSLKRRINVLKSEILTGQHTSMHSSNVFGVMCHRGRIAVGRGLV